jgi:hypothetical protein
MLKPHQYDQGLGAAVLILELAVQFRVGVTGGEKIVELGPDLRVQRPIAHESRDGYQKDANRRPKAYDELADSPSVIAVCGWH